jgi:hypothetical protein
MMEKMPQSYSHTHKGGRRVKDGMKEQHLTEARSSNVGHKKKFRAGAQDARMGGDMSGPMSPSSLQVKTRRRGQGAMNRVPSPMGRE